MSYSYQHSDLDYLPHPKSTLPLCPLIPPTSVRFSFGFALCGTVLAMAMAVVLRVALTRGWLKGSGMEITQGRWKGVDAEGLV